MNKITRFYWYVVARILDVYSSPWCCGRVNTVYRLTVHNTIVWRCLGIYFYRCLSSLLRIDRSSYRTYGVVQIIQKNKTCANETQTRMKLLFKKRRRNISIPLTDFGAKSLLTGNERIPRSSPRGTRLSLTAFVIGVSGVFMMSWEQNKSCFQNWNSIVSNYWSEWVRSFHGIRILSSETHYLSTWIDDCSIHRDRFR